MSEQFEHVCSNEELQVLCQELHHLIGGLQERVHVLEQRAEKTDSRLKKIWHRVRDAASGPTAKATEVVDNFWNRIPHYKVVRVR